MSDTTSVHTDLALKKFTGTPQDQKPNYNWRDVLRDDVTVPEVEVLCPHGTERFDLAEVADTVGKSLANLMLARGEKDIFNEKNQRFVAAVTHEVASNLTKQALSRGPLRVSLHDLYVLIEKTLVDNNAHDVAKSLLHKRARKLSSAREHPTVAVKLIRRNNQVVPWNEAKIEIAIRKAFLSLKKDSAPAPQIARAVTARATSLKQAFINIEEVQDMVQEELMKAGHFKVAEDYILYRAMRHAARAQEVAARHAGEVVGTPVAETTEAAANPPQGQDSMIVVQRADGSTYIWNGEDLKKRIEFAAIGLNLCLTADQIEAELRRSTFDNIAQGDLNNTIVLNAKTLIEKDADFAKFAGRIQLTYIYEEVLGWDIVRDGIGKLKQFHQAAFAAYIFRGIDIKRLTPRLKEYDLARLAAAIDPSADLELDFLGVQTLYDRYLIIDKTGKRSRRLETPQFFWLRVSMGLFLYEKSDRETWAIQLYGLYKNRRFCSSTPTLFNSGTLHSQLSSCYLYYVDDSLEGIMYRGIAENAQLSKWAGGLGGSWTAVRGTGAHIAGTNGESQGVIPFLKLHNDQLVAVNQGGKRKGSGCAYLESWHNDIFEFLELRRNTGDERRRTHDMNTANWIPDLFMRRVMEGGEWTLFSPNDTPDLHEKFGLAFETAYVAYEAKADRGELKLFKRVPAVQLWRKMLTMLFETGHPWITFKDACNLRSPQQHVGVVHSSNLCTEITLNTSDTETAVCNLGSVNLLAHLVLQNDQWVLDQDKLSRTVRTAMRMLDNVVDINFYATPKARTSNLRHRPVGMGVMGYADCLHRMGLAFASTEAVEFADRSMEAVCYLAYSASSALAEERGVYTSYRGSLWDQGILPLDSLRLLEEARGGYLEVERSSTLDWDALRERIRKYGMRNSNCVAIAPTATISNIVGVSASIEPDYQNIYVKSNLSGEFTMVNASLVNDLKALGLWDEVMIADLKYFDGSLAQIDRIPGEIKARYATSFEIDPAWLIEAASRRQKWIDQAQSLNLFLAAPSGKKLDETYKLAWTRGLKTTYYLRTLGATAMEKTSAPVVEAAPKFCSIDNPDCESCQ